MIQKIFFSCASIPLLLVSLLMFSCNEDNVVYSLRLEQNSRIIFIGNTFAEQLQQHNYFETMLYKSFPEHNLTVRNLAWSADEVNLQPRPLNFPTLDEQLKQYKPDVIFAFFGLNEAFKGSDSLQNYKDNLSAFLQRLKQQQFNQEQEPEIILISPIAHEKIGGFLPDPSIHNENLKLYTQGMKEVAEALGISFVDLYESSLKLMEDNSEPLTDNGIHLNDLGYQEVGEIMASVLDFPVSSLEEDSYSSNLRKAIHQKKPAVLFQVQNPKWGICFWQPERLGRWRDPSIRTVKTGQHGTSLGYFGLDGKSK
jgi:hypothetical protein